MTAGADDPRTTADARHYARIRYHLLLIDLGIGWAFLAAFQWCGWSHAAARWAAGLSAAVAVSGCQSSSQTATKKC